MKATGMLRVLLATVLLGAIVTPIAAAGAQGHRAKPPRAQARALKLLKGLRKEAAAMAGEVAALRDQLAAAGEPKPTPPSPPAGQAGGSLGGSYPNPKLRPNSITSAEVADGALTAADVAPNTIQTVNLAAAAVGSADIANGSVARVDLGPGSVGAPQLLSTHVVEAGPIEVRDGNTGERAATCPAGERLLTGGAGWHDIQPGLSILVSAPDETPSSTVWDVRVRNTSGKTQSFSVHVLCLRAG